VDCPGINTAGVGSADAMSAHRAAR
jgi:hypothetical protein